MQVSATQGFEQPTLELLKLVHPTDTNSQWPVVQPVTPPGSERTAAAWNERLIVLDMLTVEGDTWTVG